MAAGVLSISFDFEMAWGTRRSSDPDHAAGVERVREVVPAILDIFARHQISATWATVGQLMLRPEDCPNGRFPGSLPTPQPEWFEGRWLDGIPTMTDPQACRFYAPDLVEQIVNCPVFQELASHTFSHVVIGEAACTADIARAEFETSRDVGRRWGRELLSLIFPRNEIGHLNELRDAGFRCYRSINTEWYLKPHMQLDKLHPRVARFCIRLLRFVDEVLAMTPHVGPARRVAGLWELPYGMFFAGNSGLTRFVSPERLAVKAIKGLRLAARQGQVFSLYTHPHNFLPKPQRLLVALEQICVVAAQLRDAGELEIKTMEEIADDLEHGRNLHWIDSATRASRCADGWVDEFAVHPQPAREACGTAGDRSPDVIALEDAAVDSAA